MMRTYSFVVLVSSALAFVGLSPSVAAASSSADEAKKLMQKISASSKLPSKVIFRDADGNELPFIPLGYYLEYGESSLKTKGGKPDKVDESVRQGTAGMDFLTSSLWRFGVALNYVDTHDNGSSSDAQSIVTDKSIRGVSGYLARPIDRKLTLGVSAFYGQGKGKTVYNFADRNHEESTSTSFSPFLKYSVKLSDDLRLNTGGRVTSSRNSLKHDANNPINSKSSVVSAHLPVGVKYRATPNVDLGASAQANYILSAKSYSNVHAADILSVTFGADVSYTFEEGAMVYGAYQIKEFDDTYDSSRFQVGIRFPLSLLR